MQTILQYSILLILFLGIVPHTVAQDDTFPTKNDGPVKTDTPNLPPETVRMMAEWEEAEAIVIAWSHDHEEILGQIAFHAAQECLVYVLAADELSAYYYLQAQEVDMDQIILPGLSYNSIWVRDYGPWTVYQNKVEERGISDFLYNRPLRTDDDQVPYELADYLSIPIFNADEAPYKWTHTGGNFLRDGLGTAYSSDLVLRENSGKTGLELAHYADVFFGVSDYRILNRLRYDTIHHLDMHMRILDEETIAVGHYPAGVADGPWIEENLSFIRNNYRTPYGKPYRIMRLDMPAHLGQYPPNGHYRTYTNSIFINKTILVPTYGLPADSIALQQYRDFFPAYKVEGINCNGIIGELGALHCITKLVGVDEPLWIAHPRLHDTYQAGEAIEVEAWAYHHSGIENVQLFYRIAGNVFYYSSDMQADANVPGRWTTHIPPQDTGTQIEYYIAAAANDGKVQVRPQTAPQGYYPFQIKAYDAPPEADWVQQKRVVAKGSSVLFTNDSKNGHTQLYWSFPGGDPLMSTQENVRVNYPEGGTYNVRLVAINPNGQDTLLRMAAVEVKESFLPFTETFDSPLNTYWEVIDSNNDNVSWQQSTGGGCQQDYVIVPHRQSSDKLNREYLRTAIDLRGYNQAYLTFDVAYAQRSSYHFDELRFNLVDQEGLHHNIYNKGGDVLASVAAEIPDFEPIDCLDWRNDTINLSLWEGESFLLEIESIGDRGNSIYLDNLQFHTNAIPSAVIASPADESTFLGDGSPLQSTVTVEANDEDGEIVKVDFFLDNNYLGSTETPPFEIDFTLPEWGTYELLARAIDNDNTAVWTEPVSIEYELSSNIETVHNLPVNISLGPVPATDELQLRTLSEMDYWGMEFTIIDTYGRVLRQWSEDILKGKNSIQMDVDTYPSGAYWLCLAHGKQELKIQWMKAE
ncbi:MAG: agmatine deiminase family protein [Bacteroidota bacterium]